MISYSYCPQCGKKLKKDKEARPHCPDCGFTFYNNPAPTVGVLPIRGGQVLLARRAIEPRKNTIDTIGGFLDAGESLEEGARREAKEELGVSIRVKELLGNYPDQYRPGEPTLCFIFIAEIVGKSTPKAADDVASLKWYSIVNPPITQAGFKNTKQVLADLKKWYKDRAK